jgi:hypothetical protein
VRKSGRMWKCFVTVSTALLLAYLLLCPGFVVSGVCRVQGLSCPGFVLSRVCLSRVCLSRVCLSRVCLSRVCPCTVLKWEYPKLLEWMLQAFEWKDLWALCHRREDSKWLTSPWPPLRRQTALSTGTTPSKKKLSCVSGARCSGNRCRFTTCILTLAFVTFLVTYRKA